METPDPFRARREPCLQSGSASETICVLRYAHLDRLPDPGRPHLLASRVATTESPAPSRQLRVLRVVGSTLPCTDCRVDDRRFLLRASDRAHRRRGTAQTAADDLPRHQLRVPWCV